jgi:RNA polymerase sigma-70 factor (ECF subfamily)
MEAGRFRGRDKKAIEVGEVIALRPLLDTRSGAVGTSPSSVPSPESVLAVDPKAAALQHEAALLRRAMRLTRNASEAQDLVHDTFERLLRNLERYRPDTNVLVWMYTVMNNLFLDRCRRKARGPRLVSDEAENVPAPDPTPPSPPRWARVSQEQFAEAVAGLPPDFRAVFEMHALQGHPYDEIAARLEIPKNTVGTRLYRARMHLKTVLMTVVREDEDLA